MNKRTLTAALAIGFILTGLLNAASSSAETAAEKFYGKIASVSIPSKNLTVHNRKRNQDMSFNWNESTQLVSKKSPIRPEDLKVGQFLMVAYVTENNVNHATKIMVRPAPFKKAPTTDSAE